MLGGGGPHWSAVLPRWARHVNPRLHPADRRRSNTPEYDPGVAPVVEDLASKHVTSDTPFVTPALFRESIVAAHQIVEIRDLVSRMIEAWLAGAEQE